MIGTKLAHYEITSHLGTGGMGEVYQASDSKLGRSVAIKLLPQVFAQDAERVARFRREARVLASLNHPNIAVIHGLEEANGFLFLVLELVEGETLAARIARGAMPLDEALSIAKQIADALEAAHERGIIHRDLKPANIKLTRDGNVKVLDFGLAKAFAVDPTDSDPSNSPTISMAATQRGMILGTAAYMSPEQAKGRTVDKRSDIWSYGCVLYEMLAGGPAFSGDNVSDIFAAVLRAEPSWSALPSDLPLRIRELLLRCLAKEVQNRWRDIGDVRFELHPALTQADSQAERPLAKFHPQRSARDSLRAIAVTFCLTSLLGAAIAWAIWPKLPAPQLIRFGISLPPDFRVLGIGLSPDGRRIAFISNGRLYTRSLDALQTSAVVGTEGASDRPLFSPDGQWVAFFAAAQLKKVALDGSAAIPITTVPTGGLAGAWAYDGRILFGVPGPSGLFQVSQSGGNAEPLVNLDGYHDLDYPELLPGGEWLLYSAQRNSAVSIQFEIVVQSLRTRERKVVLQGGKFARYAPTGHIIYEQLGSLYAVPFDLKKLKVTGSPTPLGEHVATDISFFSPAQFAFSPNGTLVFVPGHDATKRHLVWVDRAGHAETFKGLPTRAYAAPRLSPDGERMMALMEDTGDLWVFDTRGSSIRLTRDGLSIGAAWLPDGSQVVYSSGRPGTKGTTPMVNSAGVPFSLVMQPSDGRDEGKQIDDGGSQEATMFAARLVKGPATRSRGWTFSPDGRWVAYVSDELGHDEVYVTPYPGPGGKFPVSTNGGTQPVWARNGELFYRNLTRMMAVQIVTTPALRISQPKVLFEGAYESGPGGPRANANYDVTQDGKHLLMVAADSVSDRAEEPLGPQITVVLNWFRELQERVPVK